MWHVRRLMLLATGCVAALLGAVAPAPAKADSIFVSALAGTPKPGGTVVNSREFLGARFQLSTTVTATEIGGNFFAIPGTGSHEIFGVIVQLTGPTDFPDTFTRTAPDVLASALLTIPETVASVDVSAPIGPVVLNAGYYALVFGADSPASGDVAASDLNTVIGSPSWIGGFPDLRYFNTGLRSRFFINGTVETTTDPSVAPLPRAGRTGMVLLCGLGATRRLRRRRASPA